MKLNPLQAQPHPSRTKRVNRGFTGRPYAGEAANSADGFCPIAALSAAADDAGGGGTTAGRTCSPRHRYPAPFAGEPCAACLFDWTVRGARNFRATGTRTRTSVATVSTAKTASWRRHEPSCAGRSGFACTSGCGSGFRAAERLACRTRPAFPFRRDSRATATGQTSVASRPPGSS